MLWESEGAAVVDAQSVGPAPLSRGHGRPTCGEPIRRPAVGTDGSALPGGRLYRRPPQPRLLRLPGRIRLPLRLRPGGDLLLLAVGLHPRLQLPGPVPAR